MVLNTSLLILRHLRTMLLQLIRALPLLLSLFSLLLSRLLESMHQATLVQSHLCILSSSLVSLDLDSTLLNYSWLSVVPSTISSLLVNGERFSLLHHICLCKVVFLSMRTSIRMTINLRKLLLKHPQMSCA